MAALLTELQPTSLCLTDTPIFKEMTIMYLLMALFHAPAWCEKRVKKINQTVESYDGGAYRLH